MSLYTEKVTMNIILFYKVAWFPQEGQNISTLGEYLGFTFPSQYKCETWNTCITSEITSEISNPLHDPESWL